MATTEYRCPICGDRLLLRARENEADPWLLTDTGVLHHACLVLLRDVMAERNLPDCESGARLALAALHLETD